MVVWHIGGIMCPMYRGCVLKEHGLGSNLTRCLWLHVHPHSPLTFLLYPQLYPLCKGM